MRERNQPRNTRQRTHRNDECGVRLDGRMPPCLSPHLIDRSAHALKTHALNSRVIASCRRISNGLGIANPRF